MKQGLKLCISIAILAAVAATTGCARVTILKDGIQKLDRDPDFSESYPYFVAYAFGTHHINAREACGGREPLQMQGKTTFVDGLLGAITLSIYTPRHAMVWCSSKRAEIEFPNATLASMKGAE